MHVSQPRSPVMSDSENETKSARLEPELRDMKLEEGATLSMGESDGAKVKAEDADPPTPSAIPPRLKASRSKSQSPLPKHDSEASSPADSIKEEVVGGDIVLKMEPGPGGRALKLSRSASQKVVSRPPPLYLDLPDSTEAAKDTFIVLPECTYSNKFIGTTDPALECDCSEEWGKSLHNLLFLQLGNALTSYNRCGHETQQCMWRRLRLHQPCNQDGVRG